MPLNITVARLTLLQMMLVKVLSNAEVDGLRVLCAPVEDYRPITWYAPAIYPMVEVSDDYPSLFTQYGGLRTQLDSYQLRQLYSECLYGLRWAHKTVLSHDGTWVAKAAEAFELNEPLARVVFSGPKIEFGEVADVAGVTFALEFAAACICAGHGQLIRTANDFYMLDLECGVEIGVKNGKPIGAEDYWETDISSYVALYISDVRGGGWTQQTLDTIDRIYFWSESNPGIAGLEALPELLSILKAYGGPLDQLTTQLVAMKPAPEPVTKALTLDSYFKKIDEAFGVIADITLPDSHKLSALVEILVPEIVNEAKFKRIFWNYRRPVVRFSMTDIKRMEAFLANLKINPKKSTRKRQ